MLYLLQVSRIGLNSPALGVAVDFTQPIHVNIIQKPHHKNTCKYLSTQLGSTQSHRLDTCNEPLQSVSYLCMRRLHLVNDREYKHIQVLMYLFLNIHRRLTDRETQQDQLFWASKYPWLSSDGHRLSSLPSSFLGETFPLLFIVLMKC